MAGFDVELPKSDTPKFPPICVGCGGTPTTTYKVQADAKAWWSVIRGSAFLSILGGRAFDLPACDACRTRMTRQRRLRSVGNYTFMAIAVVLSIWLIEDTGNLKGMLAMFLLVTLAMLPWTLYERFFPPTVNLSVTTSTVTFHFADRDYAQKFAKANPTV